MKNYRMSEMREDFTFEVTSRCGMKWIVRIVEDTIDYSNGRVRYNLESDNMLSNPFPLNAKEMIQSKVNSLIKQSIKMAITVGIKRRNGCGNNGLLFAE